jgi:hypothetical protein
MESASPQRTVMRLDRDDNHSAIEAVPALARVSQIATDLYDFVADLGY